MKYSKHIRKNLTIQDAIEGCKVYCKAALSLGIIEKSVMYFTTSFSNHPYYPVCQNNEIHAEVNYFLPDQTTSPQTKKIHEINSLPTQLPRNVACGTGAALTKSTDSTTDPTLNIEHAGDSEFR